MFIGAFFGVSWFMSLVLKGTKRQCPSLFEKRIASTSLAFMKCRRIFSGRCSRAFFSASRGAHILSRYMPKEEHGVSGGLVASILVDQDDMEARYADAKELAAGKAKYAEQRRVLKRGSVEMGHLASLEQQHGEGKWARCAVGAGKCGGGGWCCRHA